MSGGGIHRTCQVGSDVTTRAPSSSTTETTLRIVATSERYRAGPRRGVRCARKRPCGTPACDNDAEAPSSGADRLTHRELT